MKHANCGLVVVALSSCMLDDHTYNAQATAITETSGTTGDPPCGPYEVIASSTGGRPGTELDLPEPVEVEIPEFIEAYGRVTTEAGWVRATLDHLALCYAPVDGGYVFSHATDSVDCSTEADVVREAGAFVVASQITLEHVSSAGGGARWLIWPHACEVGSSTGISSPAVSTSPPPPAAPSGIRVRDEDAAHAMDTTTGGSTGAIGGDGSSGDEGASSAGELPPAAGDGEDGGAGLREGAPGDLDLTVTTSLWAEVSFLLEGDAPQQQGFLPGVFEPQKIALIHGTARDEAGVPLLGVEVSVHGHPEFGWTFTRSDGSFDIVVHGNEVHTLVLARPDKLGLHRAVNTVWNGSHAIEDAVLIEVDAEASLVTFTDPIEVHQSSPTADEDGVRQVTLLFQQGTQAVMHFPNGTSEPLPEMSVRATEYTMGPDGPSRMPAKLPDGTIYTYAVEFSADEAELAGAESISFDRPVFAYLENFLELPVGLVVPVGSYDTREAEWKPESDGRVIRIVGSSPTPTGSSSALVDLTGDGVPEPDTELLSDGFTQAELEILPELYSPGAEVWRVPVHHFSSHDFNNGGETPADATPPPETPPAENEPEPDACEAEGSILECENQVVGQRVSIVGTPFTLDYRSSRVRGAPNRGLRITVTGDSVPASLLRARVEVEVAGRKYESVFPPSPGQTHDFRWDGLDAFGRPVQGPQPTQVCTFFDYGAVARGTMDGNGGSETSGAFGNWLATGVAVAARMHSEIALSRCYARGTSGGAGGSGAITKSNMIRLGGLDATTISDRLGGWTLSVHHTLSRETATLFMGNGRIRKLDREAIPVAERFAGNRATTGNALTGSDAKALRFQSPTAIDAGPDGTLFVANSGLVRRINPNGSVEIVAGIAGSSGGGISGYTGDGGPATAARLSSSIRGVAADAEGGLYIADAGNSRIRYVDSAGIIKTVVGSGLSGCSDIDMNMDARGVGSPLAVKMSGIEDIALSKDGRGLWVLQCGGSSASTRLRYWEMPRPTGRLMPGEPATGRVVHFAGGAPSFVEPRPSDWMHPGDRREPDAGRIFHASFDRASSVSETAAGIFVGEGNGNSSPLNRRIRVLSPAGGYASSFRKLYEYTPGIAGCHSEDKTNASCWTLHDDGVSAPFAAVKAASGGLLFTTGGSLTSHADAQRLYFATEDRQAPPQLLMGGGSRVMTASDEYVPALELAMSSMSDIAVAPSGDVFVSDFTYGLIYRLTKAVPPMYQSSIVVSADGEEIYYFDERGRHLETRDSLTGALLWSFDYDDEGLLAAVEDGYGNRTQIERVDGVAAALVSPDGLRTTLGYDQNGYLASITNPAREVESFTYQPDGLMTSRLTPRGHKAEYAYDLLGRLQSAYKPGQLRPQEFSRSDQGEDHFVVTRTTPEGRETRYEVERAGEQQLRRRVILPDGTNMERVRNGSVIGFSDSDRTLVQSTMAPDPRLGLSSTYSSSLKVVTPSGRQLSETRSRSYVPRCTRFFDACDGWDRELQPDEVLESFTRNGRSYSELFTRAHLESSAPVPARIVWTSPMGTVTEIQLGEQGETARIQVGHLAPVHLEYDARGRLVRAIQSDGVKSRSVTIAYGSHGFIDSITDPIGRVTQYEHDEAGRITRQVLPDLREVLFSYDAGGNLIGLTPPARSVHGFTYDAVDRISRYEPPVLSDAPYPETTYAYNADHDLEIVALPDGQELRLVYGQATGKLDEIMTPAGSYYYEYDDATGQISHMVDPAGGSLTYTYDGSLILTETQAGEVAGTISRTYDDELRVATETIDGAAAVTFQYDDDGRISAAGDETLITDVATGLLTGTVLEGVRGQMVYDSFGLLEALAYAHAGNRLYDVAYTRDEVGRVKSRIDSVGTASVTRCYIYDAAGRLGWVHDAFDGSECTGMLVEAYYYDENGNRLAARGVPLVPNGTVVDEQDRVLEYGNLRFGYTANGDIEVKEDVGTGDVWEFDFDVLGNLAAVDLPGGGRLEYVTDARNRRVGKKINGVLVQGFLYRDQLNPAAELDATGQVVSTFVYGGFRNVPDYFVRDGRKFRILADHQGSVIAVVDVTTGVIVQQLQYDAWGRVLMDSNPGFQPFGFAGGLYDPDTGLVRFGARDYDASVGRWLSKDPTGLHGGTNLYEYVIGDPINFVDPTGHAGEPATPLPPPRPLPRPPLVPIPGGAGAGAGAGAAGAAGVAGAVGGGLAAAWLFCYVFDCEGMGEDLYDWFDPPPECGPRGAPPLPNPPPPVDAHGRQPLPPPAPASPPGPRPRGPGDCTPGEHDALQSVVDSICKNSGQRSCSRADSCTTMLAKIDTSAACNGAREAINAKCFRGGDEGHNEQRAQEVRLQIRCWDFYEQNGC